MTDMVNFALPIGSGFYHKYIWLNDRAGLCMTHWIERNADRVLRVADELLALGEESDLPESDIPALRLSTPVVSLWPSVSSRAA